MAQAIAVEQVTERIAETVKVLSEHEFIADVLFYVGDCAVPLQMTRRGGGTVPGWYITYGAIYDPIYVAYENEFDDIDGVAAEAAKAVRCYLGDLDDAPF